MNELLFQIDHSTFDAVDVVQTWSWDETGSFVLAVEAGRELSLNLSVIILLFLLMHKSSHVKLGFYNNRAFVRLKFDETEIRLIFQWGLEVANKELSI